MNVNDVMEWTMHSQWKLCVSLVAFVNNNKATIANRRNGIEKRKKKKNHAVKQEWFGTKEY